MNKLHDKLAELFNHLEHNDDEVGAKLAQEALDLFNVSNSFCSLDKSYSDCGFHSDNKDGCLGCNHLEQYDC